MRSRAYDGSTTSTDYYYIGQIYTVLYCTVSGCSLRSRAFADAMTSNLSEGLVLKLLLVRRKRKPARVEGALEYCTPCTRAPTKPKISPLNKTAYSGTFKGHRLLYLLKGVGYCTF